MPSVVEYIALPAAGDLLVSGDDFSDKGKPEDTHAPAMAIVRPEEPEWTEARLSSLQDRIETGIVPLVLPLLRRLAHLRMIGGNPTIGMEEYRLACIPLGIVPRRHIPDWFASFAATIVRLTRDVLAGVGTRLPATWPGEVEGSFLGKVPSTDHLVLKRLTAVCAVLVLLSEKRLDRGELRPEREPKQLQGFDEIGPDFRQKHLPDGRFEIWFAHAFFRLTPAQADLLRRTWQADQQYVTERSTPSTKGGTLSHPPSHAPVEPSPHTTDIQGEPKQAEIVRLRHAVDDFRTEVTAELDRLLVRLQEGTFQAAESQGSTILAKTHEKEISPVIEHRLAAIETAIMHLQQAVNGMALAIGALQRSQQPALQQAVATELRAAADERTSSLSPRQQQVFHALRRITGTGADARIEAERLLSELAGEPITEAFVSHLKPLLKTCGWGIRCSCGAAAAPLWHRSLECAERGFMCFTHTGETGRSVMHGGYTSIPASLCILERFDRRSKRKRTST